MKTLSVCFIVKNEEKILKRILSQVKKFADEIIVVDTGSNDNTIKIAKEFTKNVHTFKWCNDFSKARNYSLSFATCDYVMWLDADDYIDDISIKKLKALKNKLKNQDFIMLPYEIAFDEMGNPTFSYYRERIFKNHKGFKFVDPIHEVIVPSGIIEYKKIPIKHKKEDTSNPKRNLEIYEGLKAQNYTFSPRQQFYYANELYYNEIYKEAIIEYEKFLNMNGFVENNIQACLNMARIYRTQKEYTKALNIAYRSFIYSKPKPEILCEIGYIYLLLQKYDCSIFWYKLALQKTNLKSGAFVEQEYYNFIPLVQIGLCYYYLGKYKSAYNYNKKALKYKPNNFVAQTNQNIYLSLLNK